MKEIKRSKRLHDNDDGDDDGEDGNDDDDGNNDVGNDDYDNHYYDKSGEHRNYTWLGLTTVIKNARNPIWDVDWFIITKQCTLIAIIF